MLSSLKLHCQVPESIQYGKLRLAKVLTVSMLDAFPGRRLDIFLVLVTELLPPVLLELAAEKR